MMKKVNKVLRLPLRFALAFYCFFYDAYRYYWFSAFWENLKHTELRGFVAARLYHSLEKSASFRRRKETSGWSQAQSLFEVIKLAVDERSVGFHDAVGLKVLSTFVNDPATSELPQARLINSKLEHLYSFESPSENRDEHKLEDQDFGALTLGDLNSIRPEMNVDETFFSTRRSIRSYLDYSVPDELFNEALQRAMYAPSSCNRQPWVVYQTVDPEVRDLALSFQNGNLGFGHEAPGLAIVAVNTKAYISGVERAAYLVDGSIFATTLIYSLHSLGIGSCCLNWSVAPSKDLKIRRSLSIRAEHSIVMMLLYGYPDPSGKVCASARRPIEQVKLHLDRRNPKVLEDK